MRDNLLAQSLRGYVQSYDQHIGVADLATQRLIREATLEADVVPVTFVEVPACGHLRIAVAQDDSPFGIALDGKVVG